MSPKKIREIILPLKLVDIALIVCNNANTENDAGNDAGKTSHFPLVGLKCLKNAQ